MMERAHVAIVGLLLSACRTTPDTSPNTEGAGGTGVSDSGMAGSAGSTCSLQRVALATSVRQSSACAVDADCVEYDAPCLMEESGNCAGIFYVAKEKEDAVATLLASYEACIGIACGAGGAGGSCGLGGLPPACLQGTCQGKRP